MGAYCNREIKTVLRAKLRRKGIGNSILPIKMGSLVSFPFCILNSGAGEESRTLDLNLGKVALYQLSYSRINKEAPL